MLGALTSGRPSPLALACGGPGGSLKALRATCRGARGAAEAAVTSLTVTGVPDVRPPPAFLRGRGCRLVALTVSATSWEDGLGVRLAFFLRALVAHAGGALGSVRHLDLRITTEVGRSLADALTELVRALPSLRVVSSLFPCSPLPPEVCEARARCLWVHHVRDQACGSQAFQWSQRLLSPGAGVVSLRLSGPSDVSESTAAAFPDVVELHLLGGYQEYAPKLRSLHRLWPALRDVVVEDVSSSCTCRLGRCVCA